MKNKIIKFNILFVILFVLFTSFLSVYAAADLTEEDIALIEGALSFRDRYVREANGAPIYAGSATATTIIDSEVISKLAEKGLYLVTYPTSDGIVLGVQKGMDNTDVNKISPIQLVDTMYDYDIDLVPTSESYEDVHEHDEEIYYNIEDYNQSGITVLTPENTYAFRAQGFYSTSERPNMRVTSNIVEDTPDEELPDINVEQPDIINEWHASQTTKQTIQINPSNCIQQSDGTYRYYFTVDSQGTWKVSSETGVVIWKGQGGQTGELVANFGYSEPFGNGEASHDNFIMRPGEVYYIDITEEDMANGGYTLDYTFLHNSSYVDTQDSWNVHDENVQKDTLFQTIEYIISNFLILLGDVLNWMLSDALGQTITLDNVVFNEYEPTKIKFFFTDLQGNSIAVDNTIGKIRLSINEWFGIFRDIALIGYLMILIYIGIKTLFASTTANKKASYKETLWAWVAGLLILFFFPYFMKYSIALNDSFVHYISGMNEGMRKDTAPINQEYNKGYIYTDFEKVIDFSNGEDYLSEIAEMAIITRKLGVAIAYLVLTWQLIMMVIFYYKRLFIIAFLIIIFPLIALTFVFDKLNDGKSQALSSWTKEFLASVFVQSFHAIIYIFICFTIYETLRNDTADFILLVTATTFMFAGEDIMKQIFGIGDTTALGTVTQNAAKISITTNLLLRVGTRFMHNTFAKDGLLRSGFSSIGRARKYGVLLRRAPDGETYFQKVASNPEQQRRVAKLLPSEGEVTPYIKKTAETVDKLNNFDKISPEDRAKVLKDYDKLMKQRNDPSATTDLERRQFDAIIGNSNVTPRQIDMLNTAVVTAAKEYASGKDSKTIRQKLRLEVEYAFKAKDENGKVINEGKLETAEKFMHAALINVKEKGVEGTKREDVERAWVKKQERLEERYENMGFSKAPVADTSTRRDRAQSISEKYVKQKGGESPVSATEKMRIDKTARYLTTLEQLEVQKVTESEAIEAIKGLEAEKELAKDMARLSNIRGEIEDLKYLLAKKVITDGSGSPANTRWASSVVHDIESEVSRGNNTTDTKYNIDDPLVKLYDILDAAQRGSTNRKVGRMDQAFVNASRGAVVNDVIDDKMSKIRIQNQYLLEKSIEFAEEALEEERKEIGRIKRKLNEIEANKKEKFDEPTYNGYTEKEIRKLRNIEIGNAIAKTGSLLTEVAITPVATVAGAAIGSAMTTDGIPLEEGIIGALSGSQFASTISEGTIPTLTSQERRNRLQKEIESKVKKRIKNEEKAKTKLKVASDDAKEKEALKEEFNLEVKLVDADLTLEGDVIKARVHILAEHAKYVYIGEVSKTPTSGWKEYKEYIDYDLEDDDATKIHDLFVYIQGESGEIKNVRIGGLRV